MSNTRAAGRLADADKSGPWLARFTKASRGQPAFASHNDGREDQTVFNPLPSLTHIACLANHSGSATPSLGSTP